MLESVEEEEFFVVIRSYTLHACFTLPEHGSNQEEAGWELIGFEHGNMHQPPFGEYDRDQPDSPEPPAPGPTAPPPLQGPGPVRFQPVDEVDFVVVGAGAAGGAIAWELARAGMRVVVLEQGPLT